MSTSPRHAAHELKGGPRGVRGSLAREVRRLPEGHRVAVGGICHIGFAAVFFYSDSDIAAMEFDTGPQGTERT
jgi:hypothetical protein